MKTAIIVLLIIITFFSCSKPCYDKKNPECENYNPCFGQISASADFGIYEIIDNTQIETDTVMTFKPSTLFQAKKDADTFIWKIGNEVILGKEFYRRGFPERKPISVQLIAKKSKELNPCLSIGELSDTVTKSFVAIKWDTNHVLAGRWLGSNIDNPEDTFSIYWGKWINPLSTPDPFVMTIEGLPKGIFYPIKSNELYFEYDWEVAARSAKINGSSNYPISIIGLKAIFMVENGMMQVNYSYNDYAYQKYQKGEKIDNSTIIKTVNKTFIGRKVK